MTAAPVVQFRNLPGPQRAFSRTSADIAVFGGAAGGGKTHALLLEAARHVDRPGYRGVIFRRTNPQIMAGGGLWDAAGAVYPRVGGRANITAKEYRFGSGARVSFRHLQHEPDIYDWQGAELAFIGWDELTHFTERQFFYLLSRNRTTCGVRPYVRATCNPDAGSWVKGFIGWWLDPATGYPVPERAGVLRWFYRVGEDISWFGSRAEAMDAHPDLAADAPPKSVTFIPAKLSDNAVLCSRDPGYRANLMALSWVERGRLLDGNWNVTAADGLFKSDWFGPPSSPPDTFKRVVRSWDLAATEQKDANDPDWLASVKLGLAHDDTVWVLDAERHRVSPLKVRRLIQQAAERDGAGVQVVIEQEPASAGKILAAELKAWLARDKDDDGNPKPKVEAIIFRPDQTTGDKVTRAYPFSAVCERGLVRLAPGSWVRPLLAELAAFPTKGVHDDWVDAAVSGHRALSRSAGVRVITA